MSVSVFTVKITALPKQLEYINFFIIFPTFYMRFCWEEMTKVQWRYLLWRSCPCAKVYIDRSSLWGPDHESKIGKIE